MDNEKKKSKIRLDLLLFEKGYFESRTKAEIAIREGNVLVNNIKEDKPGTIVKEDSEIRILGNKCPFVSRGGYKLDKAIKTFNINLENFTQFFTFSIATKSFISFSVFCSPKFQYT